MNRINGINSYNPNRSDSFEKIVNLEELNPQNYRQQTYLESFFDFLTNSRYNIQSFKFPIISNQNILINEASPKVVLLGHFYIYNSKNSQSEIKFIGQEKKSANYSSFIYNKSDTTKIHKIADLNKLNLILSKNFENIIWFTYRRNFPILYSLSAEKSYISDTGWGCMVRAGQMMFAELLRRHLFDEKTDLNIKIIRLFLDSELDFDKAPFSMKQITTVSSKNFKVYPGDWFKATTIILSLEELFEKFIIQNPKFSKKIGFAVFSDGCLFLNKINERVCGENSKIWEKSLFLMVCLRIGSYSPNPEYFPMVKYLLESEYSIGILGGKPKRALYFVGYQDDNLIIKDPHYVQESVEFIDKDKQTFLSTFFNNDMKGYPIKSIDSSLAFGFYCRNKNEFDELYDYLKNGEQKIENWTLGLQEELVFEDIDDNYIEYRNNDEYEIMGFK